MNDTERLMRASNNLNVDAIREYENNITIAKRLLEHKREIAKKFLIEAQEKCDHPNVEKKQSPYIDVSVLFKSGNNPDDLDEDNFHMYDNTCLICKKKWRS